MIRYLTAFYTLVRSRVAREAQSDFSSDTASERSAVDNPSAALALVIGSTLAGISSTLLFNRFAPQERLAETDQITASVQQKLKNHAGDVADALPLLKQNLQLALQRLTISLLP